MVLGRLSYVRTFRNVNLYISQGDPFSPLAYVVVANAMVEETLDRVGQRADGICMRNARTRARYKLSIMLYADDSYCIAPTLKDASILATEYARTVTDFGLRVNVGKTEAWVVYPPGGHDIARHKEEYKETRGPRPQNDFATDNGKFELNIETSQNTAGFEKWEVDIEKMCGRLKILGVYLARSGAGPRNSDFDYHAKRRKQITTSKIATAVAAESLYEGRLTKKQIMESYLETSQFFGHETAPLRVEFCGRLDRDHVNLIMKYMGYHRCFGIADVGAVSTLETVYGS